MSPPGRAAPGILSRSLTLEPVLSSAGQARRLLRAVLADAGQPQWLDAAELACTELVTNAVVHARTTIDLTVTVTSDGLRVEVRDANPALPVPRHYGPQATTGRGMSVVAAVTSTHGVLEAGPSGKTVWFTVTDRAEPTSEEDLLEVWADADWDLHEPAGPASMVASDEWVAASAAVAGGAEAASSGPGSPAARPVRLLGLPPALWLAAREHHDALLRELLLHLATHDAADDGQVDLAAADRARTVVSTAVLAAVREADRGSDGDSAVRQERVPDPLDVEVIVSVELASAFAALQDALDAGEQLAVAGLLLVPPGLPEVVAVRDWACEQVVAQLAGVPATAWPGAAHERFVNDVRGWVSDALADVDLPGVHSSLTAVVAADQFNRIVAVSEPLAQLVGCTAEELVGRRVVTLVPPRLREAHVVGFSRHLHSGQARPQGVPVVLPLLRADGSEVSCWVRLGQAAVEHGALYLAWLEPVDDDTRT